MKGPIPPVSAKNGSPVIASKDRPSRIPVACGHSLPCWAQWLGVLGCTVPVSGEPGAISLVQRHPGLVPALPHSEEFINILSLLNFSALLAFLPFSHYLNTLRSTHPLFLGGERHPFLSVTSSSWASSHYINGFGNKSRDGQVLGS